MLDLELHRLAEQALQEVGDFGDDVGELEHLRACVDALARFDFDTLLADAGVVRAAAADRAARTMVEAMVGIGRSMGYQVVAKGVETGTELHTLLALGCSQMQGPVFGNAARRLIERSRLGGSLA